MEPVLFKIKNLINKLNIPSWFNNWFVFKKSFQQQIYITYNTTINFPPKKEQIVEMPKDTERPKLRDERAEVEFTEDQIRLITKINIAHKINGFDYDFREDYKWALYYIQKKPTTDWPYNAAMRISQTMQDIDLFGAFEEPEAPDKKNYFNKIKSNINYLYSKIIQELRHTDKRNQIEKQFKGPYHNIMQKKPNIKDSDYEDIFNGYQNLLIELFQNFPLKKI